MTYYGELYKHKKVRKATLTKLIEDLTLKLTPEDETTLEGEILEEEMLEAILRSQMERPQGQIHFHMKHTKQHQRKQQEPWWVLPIWSPQKGYNLTHGGNS